MAPHRTHRTALALLSVAAAVGLCSASPAQVRPDVHERIHAVLEGVDADATEAPVGLAGELARLGVVALPGLFDCLATGRTAVPEPLAITPGRRMLVLAALDRLPRSHVRAHLLASGAPPAPARATAAALEVFGVVGSARDLEAMIALTLPAREEQVEYRAASALEDAVTRILERDGSAVHALAVHLTTTDERLWMWLVRPLSRVEDPGSLLALSSLLGRVPGKDPLVLGAMAKAAPGARRPLDQAVVWKVVGCTQLGDPALARTAATCLGRLEVHAAVPALIDLLEQEDARVAEAAHWALRRLAGVNLGRDAEHWRTWYAGELEWWESDGAPLCARLLEAEPHEVYRLLGDLASRRVLRHLAVEPLLTLLEHPEPQVRATACRALGGIRSPESLAGLEASLSDTASDVRLSARQALDNARRQTPTDRENER